MARWRTLSKLRNGMVLKRFRYRLLPLMVTGLLASCRVAIPSGTLEPDMYHIINYDQPAVKGKRVYVIDSGDSLQLVIPATDERRYVSGQRYSSWTFQRTEIDVDIFTLPFKIRPARTNLPAQLNSNFNAAVYVGRRIDLYNFRYKTITPTFAVRQLRRRGFGYGLFGGVGSTVINDFVARIPLGIEYDGVVVNAGFATLYDARIFNIGLALGFDHLIDNNRQHWIYQQKPWFGVLFGLNLN